MNYLLITLAILVITNWTVLTSFFKRRVKITHLQNNPINEELIQKIISSITNGLTPRLVLTTVAKENNLRELARSRLCSQGIPIKNSRCLLPSH